MNTPDVPHCSRRSVLRTLAALPLAALTACHLFEDAEIRVGTLAELRSQGILEVDFNDARIHVRMATNNLPECIDLTCTHKQCTVRWKAAEHQFVCPCHEGRFDHGGQVVSGKPEKPLRRLRAELRGQEVWVLNEAI